MPKTAAAVRPPATSHPHPIVNDDHLFTMNYGSQTQSTSQLANGYNTRREPVEYLCGGKFLFFSYPTRSNAHGMTLLPFILDNALTLPAALGSIRLGHDARDDNGFCCTLSASSSGLSASHSDRLHRDE